jgi:hypothetical protein
MRKLIVFLTALGLLAATAHAEQKNVQLLTNRSDAELLRDMNMMSASLGVRCDFCHAASKDQPGHLDFASDEKREKKTAREMISMVLKLNKDQFGGNTVIGCYTCHRGSTHVTALVPLPVPTPARTERAEAPERPKLPALADVVGKYTAAVGNAAKWESRLLRGTRETSDGKSMQVELDATPAKTQLVTETPQGKREMAVTPDAAAAFVPTLPSAIPADARVVGEEKIGDRQTVVVFSRSPHRRERDYFDTTTGLLVRRVVITDSPVGPIPQQTDFEDWRDAGGTKLPFTIRTASVEPWNTGTWKFSEVKLR